MSILSIMYVSLPKKNALCQFLGKNGPNFNKNSTKLPNEALIGKKCRNKSWRKFNLISENVNINCVCMLVCQKNDVLCPFFLKNGQNFN